MRTRALRPVRQERNRHILGPKLTVIATYSPLVDTRDRFGKRVGIIPVLDLNMDISLPVRSTDLIGRDLFAGYNFELTGAAKIWYINESQNRKPKGSHRSVL